MCLVSSQIGGARIKTGESVTAVAAAGCGRAVLLLLQTGMTSLVQAICGPHRIAVSVLRFLESRLGVCSLTIAVSVTTLPGHSFFLDSTFGVSCVMGIITRSVSHGTKFIVSTARFQKNALYDWAHHKDNRITDTLINSPSARYTSFHYTSSETTQESR